LESVENELNGAHMFVCRRDPVYITGCVQKHPHRIIADFANHGLEIVIGEEGFGFRSPLFD
jgi:hypothetical protein